jgi:tetrahydromethanopterin S-methyltransferase subunit B
MTISISDNNPRVSYTVAEGVTQTAFTVNFEFFDDADLNFYVDGTLKTLTTHYTVTGGNGATGTINTTAGNSVTGIAGGSTVVITREIALARTTDFPSSGAFQVATLNTELDRFTAIAADILDDTTRSIQLADSDATASMTLPLKADRVGKVLGFNATTGAVEAGPTIADVSSLAQITTDISTLADIEDGTDATDAIQTVAGISGNVTTVAGISANVTTVAGISSDVTAVVADATDIGTVATNISSVNTVATNIADVITVANDLNEAVSELETVANDLNEATSEIDTVAGSISNVDTVGTNISNVNTVAGISANVTTVAGVSANVTTVAGISGNVSTVAGISSDVTTVANDGTDIGTVATNITNVNTVAGVSGNVTTVAGISANVTTVAGISSDVTTVAGDSTAINTVANDATDIGLVAGSISNVNNVGGSIANVNTVATNLASVNSFANTYRIASSAPTTSLDLGDLYFDTTSDTLKVYGASGWQNAGSSINGTSQRYHYDISGTPTSVTGADANGNTLTYDAGYVDVYVNGVRMSTADVTVTSGDTVTFTEALADGDEVDIVGYGTFSVASLNADNLDSGTVPDARITGAYTGITNLTMSGNLTVDTSTLYVDSANNRVGIGTTSPSQALTVASSGSGARISLTDTDSIATAMTGLIEFDGSDTRAGFIGYNSGNLTLRTDSTDSIIFSTNASEAMRIDSSGRLLVGKTSTDFNTEGMVISPTFVNLTRDGNATLGLNRLNSDGDIIGFYRDGGTAVGSIGSVSSGANLYISANSGVGLGIGGDNLYPVNASGASTDGQLDIGDASARFRDCYLSGGIQFDAAGEFLDDYEEGTWTASLYGTTSGTGVNVTHTAHYSKVGNIVTVGGYFQNINLSSMSGSVNIAGLPFTATGNSHPGSIALYGFTFSGFVTPYIYPAGTTIDILDSVTGAAWAGLAVPAAAGKYLMFSLTYRAS